MVITSCDVRRISVCFSCSVTVGFRGVGGLVRMGEDVVGWGRRMKGSLERGEAGRSTFRAG